MYEVLERMDVEGVGEISPKFAKIRNFDYAIIAL
jgi:hypothetical protein